MAGISAGHLRDFIAGTGGVAGSGYRVRAIRTA
jgi:hypothetical protein